MSHDSLRSRTRLRPSASAEEDGHEGASSERWLVSYADFITVLMALFLVMYAMSELDKNKFAAMAEGLRVGFLGPDSVVVVANGGNAPIVAKLYPSGGYVEPASDYLPVEQVLPLRDRTPAPVVQPPTTPKPATSATPTTPKPAQPSEDDVLKRFQQDLSGVSLAGADLSTYLNDRGLIVSIVGRYLFEPGSDVLKPEAIAALRPLAAKLRSYDRTVMVEGYPGKGETPSGMLPNDLGTRRAAAVVSFLSGQGMPPSYLVTVGFGEVSSTGQGRVDLVVVRRSGE